MQLEREGRGVQLRYINCFVCAESAFLFNKLLIVSQTDKETERKPCACLATLAALLTLAKHGSATVACPACHLQPFEFISLCNAIRLLQMMKIYCFH